ncbi:short-chain dehydrogenase [Colletotrichum truncatum]|uniref:Short-chain dehydrogenase n=1 Tax=Colletotrichum truncatum TaxID=5467 RepID=A0ACC3YUY8_COLTU|nr:short-chain dehydrogenase [Colletotrichum truncatum]KAF6785936.1 short-chain dehydrogenase [Colletotrichum truncatum]
MKFLLQMGIPVWLWLLAMIGLTIVLFFAVQLVDQIIFHFHTPSSPLIAYKRKGPKPTYALVTGASAGIGYGIAKTLVRHGFGVILLGHLAEEVTQAASELQSMDENIPVKTIVMDAQTATMEDIRTTIKNTIENAGLQVSILVNNVGSNPVARPPFRALSTYSNEDIDGVIDLNARFMARLTSLMLPILCNTGGTSKQPRLRQRSLILNISSGGMIGSPWLVMYCATKAFNWAFSISLARELEASKETSHVDSLCVVPGDVRSQGNCIQSTKGAPDSDTFGRLIVERTDGAIARGWREMRPYWLHELQYTLLRLIPESTRTRALIDVLGKKRDGFNAAYPKDD